MDKDFVTMQIISFVTKIISFPFIILIKGYQLLVSPLIGQNCRFYPSCSHYAHEAIETHGPIVGLLLATKRITKCHPYNEGGHDPVPKGPIVFKNFRPYYNNNSLLDNVKKRPNGEKSFNDN